MLTHRLSTYRRYVREQLEAAFSEDHPPTDIAATFSFGLFAAAIPNFGLTLVVFAALARYVDRVSNLALLSVLVIMNPPVKWGIYAAGFWLGARLLGPVPGVSVTEFSVADLSLSVGPEVLIRVFVGSIIISGIIGLVGYVMALRFIAELHRREVDVVDQLPDMLTE